MDKPNYVLLIFDMCLLPIHMIRLVLIYFCGSKYNLLGFHFLDVIMHAEGKYFNQENCSKVNTSNTDYRVAIRDDSRIYPIEKKLIQDNEITSIYEELKEGLDDSDKDSDQDSVSVKEKKSKDNLYSLRSELNSIFD